MRVKLFKDFNYNGKKYNKGDTADVDDAVAKRFIDAGVMREIRDVNGTIDFGKKAGTSKPAGNSNGDKIQP